MAELVWYASYGSNLNAKRFDCYLRGGRPQGASRTYPGCRDRTPARDDRPFVAEGLMHFAWESPTWGGGIAFFDPGADGRALMRAWLVTAEQFADIAAQEMHRDPGEDLDLREVLAEWRHRLGPGRYETLLLLGELDGFPVLTFSHDEAPPPNAPAGAYLRMVGGGLAESHGLGLEQCADYLAGCPGIGRSRAELVDELGGLFGER